MEGEGGVGHQGHATRGIGKERDRQTDRQTDRYVVLMRNNRPFHNRSGLCSAFRSLLWCEVYASNFVP